MIIMQKKIPIKVIKRDERNRQQQQPVAEVAPERKTAQEAARDMVANVTQWVNEFHQKRRSETAQAIKTLFSDPTPQTSKA
jgi:formylglycine-generating enzyme required for sulfatase activity